MAIGRARHSVRAAIVVRTNGGQRTAALPRFVPVVIEKWHKETNLLPAGSGTYAMACFINFNKSA